MKNNKFTSSIAKVQLQIILILFVIALVSSIIGLLLTKDIGGFILNIGAEIGGALVTFLLIDMILAGQAELTRLIARLGSKDNPTAKQAVNEMRRLGMLMDGSLKGAYLKGADLRGSNLRGAVLEEVDLRDADLQNATLIEANMQNSVLENANLEKALLSKYGTQLLSKRICHLQIYKNLI
jgi:uncharacterized protein YjbI with pentapeptide repeats